MGLTSGMALRFITLFGIVASIVTGIAVGILGYRSWSDRGIASRQADVIERAAAYIQLNYVEEIPRGQLVNDALAGMLNGLDGYSRLLDPDAYKRLRSKTAGRFGGIGIELGLVGGHFTVLAALDQTPAAQAGLAAGDRLIALNNAPLKGKKLLEAVELLRGPQGTDVRLTLTRSGREFVVTLTRAKIAAKGIRTRWLAPGYAYVGIARFQRDTGQDFADAVLALAQERNIDGLVLDLRNNPGGVLGASVDVADALLERGLLVCTEGRPAAKRLQHRSSIDDLLEGAPVAVLINESSASGSEIVASALQDHGRATVIGAKSYGKGSVQSVLPLAGDRALKLTTAYYFRPHGGPIHQQGVVPDMAIDPADDVAALALAVRVLREG